MGLGSAFGDQVYVCKACGHSSGLYSPNCPSCLGKTFQRVEKVQQPGPSSSSSMQAPRYEDSSPPGRFPIELLAIVCGLIVLGYFVYMNLDKKPEPAPIQVTEPPPKVERPRPIVRRPVKHTAPVAAAPKPHAAKAASVAAAHRAPMKIFSGGDDE